jgi:hypothetical protein
LLNELRLNFFVAALVVLVFVFVSQAKRTELASIALYEGVIDSTELTPFASSRTRAASAFLSSSAASANSDTRSAYGSPAPIAMQKTYVLPRSVTALHHTITAHGLANKNLLMAFRNGQIYSIDFRQIHPRRPFTDPSNAGNVFDGWAL